MNYVVLRQTEEHRHNLIKNTHKNTYKQVALFTCVLRVFMCDFLHVFLCVFLRVFFTCVFWTVSVFFQSVPVCLYFYADFFLIWFRLYNHAPLPSVVVIHSSWVPLHAYLVIIWLPFLYLHITPTTYNPIIVVSFSPSLYPQITSTPSLPPNNFYPLSTTK